MSDELKNIDYNDSERSERKGKRSRVLIGLLALLLVGSVAGGIFLFQDSDSAKSGLRKARKQISSLNKQLNNLRTENDTLSLTLQRERVMRTRLQQENDTLRTLLPMHIAKIEVANADGNGNTISAYGKSIDASSSMYLMPRITYWGLKVGDKITLNVRLYDNEGKLVTGTTSPAGYSYSCKIEPIQPNMNTQSLSGWGGADKGHFKPGTYRYEVWWEDMCLKQLSFTLK